MFKMNVKWDNYVCIITILFILIYIIMCFFLLIYMTGFLNRIALIIIPIVLVPFCFMAPKQLRLEEKQLVLSKMIGEFRIELSQIADVGIYNEKEMNIRLCGSGGFLGYLGIFRNKSLGKYIAYVGNYSQAFWIRMKNGKCYMFSCEDRDLLISSILKKLPSN